MKILVADDHALIREGLRMVLRDFDEPVECVDAFDGASVCETLVAHPDVELVLLDRRLPDCDGMDLLGRLIEDHPALPIVMLSGEFDADTVSQALGRGAAGFIPKTSVTTVLVSALRLIMAGGVYVPPELLRLEPRGAGHAPAGVHVGTAFTHGVAAGTAHAQGPGGGFGTPHDARPGADPASQDATMTRLGFTDRQSDVLSLLMEGKSNKQISRELDLAEATVKVHVRSILRVLDASSRTEAVVAASRLGLSPEGIRRGEKSGR